MIYVKFGIVDSSEKTIGILEGRWRTQTAKQKGDKISKMCSMGYVEEMY